MLQFSKTFKYIVFFLFLFYLNIIATLYMRHGHLTDKASEAQRCSLTASRQVAEALTRLSNLTSKALVH